MRIARSTLYNYPVMSWLQTTDDLGFKVELQSRPERIVSLVPSWTETVFAFGLGDRLVGVTRFCIAPQDADSVAKIGGTKNPDVNAIAGLAPELVIANAEENRREDIERLRSLGIPVFTTYPRKIGSAVESIMKLGLVLGCATAANVLA